MDCLALSWISLQTSGSSGAGTGLILHLRRWAKAATDYFLRKPQWSQTSQVSLDCPRWELWFLHIQWAQGPRNSTPHYGEVCWAKLPVLTDGRFQSGTAVEGEGQCHLIWVHTHLPKTTFSCTVCRPDKERDSLGMMARDRWNGNKNRN